MPTTLLFLKAKELADVYGPIVSYRLMGQTVILLNSARTASDLLDRSSKKTSDRPNLLKAKHFMTRHRKFGLSPKNESWRVMRRATHQSLTARAVKDYEPMMQEEATLMIEGLLGHPDVPVRMHLHHAAGSIGMRSLFGSATIPLHGGQSAERIEKITAEFISALLPGGSILDVLPFLEPIIRRTSYLRNR